MSKTIKYYCLKDDLSIKLMHSEARVRNAKIIVQKNLRYPGIERSEAEVTLYIHEHSIILEIDVPISEVIEIN
jgi:hypothetical protein